MKGIRLVHEVTSTHGKGGVDWGNTVGLGLEGLALGVGTVLGTAGLDSGGLGTAGLGGSILGNSGGGGTLAL